jgi:hypothetical protein
MFNILKREIRINKHGFPVIKLVRDDTQIDNDAASLNIPAVTEIKVDATEQRRASLASELSAQFNQELGMPTMAETTLRGYSKWTLEVLQQKFGETDGLEPFMKRTHYFRNDEDMVRSAAIFHDQISPHPKINSGSTLQSVKESLGMENLSDAEEGTDNHDEVTSIVRVAMANAQMKWDRKASSLTGVRRTDRNGRFVTSYAHRGEQISPPATRVISDGSMTPELAKVITDYPDRTDDIIEHIKERFTNQDVLDIDFLRINLDNASPALADGLL